MVAQWLSGEDAIYTLLKANRRYCVKPHAHPLPWERLGKKGFLLATAKYWQQRSQVQLSAHAELHLFTPRNQCTLSRLTIIAESLQDGSGKSQCSARRGSVGSLCVWGYPVFRRKGNRHFLFSPVRFNCFLPPEAEVTQARKRMTCVPNNTT